MALDEDEDEESGKKKRRAGKALKNKSLKKKTEGGPVVITLTTRNKRKFVTGVTGLLGHGWSSLLRVCATTGSFCGSHYLVLYVVA